MIQIRRKSRTNPDGYIVVYQTPLNSGAKATCRLMDEDSITLPFSTLQKLHFEIGDYIDLAEDEYNDLELPRSLRQRYVVTTKQVPTYNVSTGGYDWQLRLDAYYWSWNNRIFKFTPERHAQEAQWGLTDTIGRFLDIFKRNLSVYGFGQFGAIVDQDLTDCNINLSFEGTRMIDALKMICSNIHEEYNVECEWWVRDGYIHIGRCEQNADNMIITNEGDDMNAASITPEDADQEYANRLIVFGGTQNISARYRKTLYLTADQVTPVADGVVVRDTTKVNFSPAWFRIGERIYRQPVTLRHSTSFDGYYFEDDFLRLYQSAGPGSPVFYTTTIGTFDISNLKQLAEYNIGVICHLLSCASVGGNANGPNEEDTTRGYRILNAAATMYLERGNERVVVAKAESEYPAEHISLSASGSEYRFMQSGQWTLRIEYMIEPEGVYINEAPYGNIFATFNTSASLRLTADEAFRVETKVDIGNSQYDAIINPTMADPSRDEARDVKIAGLSSLDTGTRLSFPNIVRGKADAGYFSAEGNEQMVNSIVNRNLMLPNGFYLYYETDGTVREATDDEKTKPNARYYSGTNYIDVQKDIDDSQIVEKLVTFDKIYPKQKLNIAATGHYTRYTEEKNDTGTDVGIMNGVLTKTHYYWQFILPDLQFSEDCLIEGETLGVTFQSGKLKGLSFKLAWRPDHDTIGTGDDNHRWEIVNNEDYGIELPNSLMHPEQGDQVIITGWNCEALDDDNTLIADAEREMLAEVIKMANRIAIDPHTYRVVMKSNFIHQVHAYDYPISIGNMLTLANEYLFSGGRRQVRIIGYEINLDLPYDSPVLILGDKLPKSNLRSARERLDNIDNSNLSATPFVTN